MITRRFGKTDFQVSTIGFGGAAVSGEGGGYGFGEIDEAESLRLLNKALDAGINLFDTAPIYGFGMSERRIGKAFKDKRDKVYIVSKCGVTWDENKWVRMDNSPDIAEKMLHTSLKDLGTDYIDLYMIHWPDRNTDIRKPMEVLKRAKSSGKIRTIGLCNTNKDDFEKASEIDEISVFQSEYNLFSRGIENSLGPIMEKNDIGFMSYGTLDKGILTGRVTKDRKFDKSDARSKAPWWKNVDRTPKYLAMERINSLLDSAGHSGLELALGFVLANKDTSTALCGTRNTAQLESALRAVEHLPSQEVIEQAIIIADTELGESR